MRVARQAASGLIYGIVALVLVIGSLALAQAQAGSPGIAASTYTPLPSSTATPRASPAAAGTSPTTSILDPTATTASKTPANPTQAEPSTATRTAVPVTTATKRTSCGAPYGWVQAFVVQNGDTLFRIARSYGVTVEALQRANCRSSTVIYAGERLWVPFEAPVATELTVIPTFPTPTEPSATTQSVEPVDTAVTSDP